MKRICGRRFDVDYHEKDEHTWVAVSHLVDDIHDITVELEVSVPDMTIGKAAVRLDRYPLDPCPLIAKKASGLEGLNLMEDFRQKALALFGGPEGCGNVIALLGAAAPGLPYFYFPHQMKTGKMRPDEFVEVIKTRLADACLAHTMMKGS